MMTPQKQPTAEPVLMPYARYQIACRVREGLTNAQIARAANFQPSGVTYHVSMLRAQFRVTSREALIAVLRSAPLCATGKMPGDWEYKPAEIAPPATAAWVPNPPAAPSRFHGGQEETMLSPQARRNLIALDSPIVNAALAGNVTDYLLERFDKGESNATDRTPDNHPSLLFGIFAGATSPSVSRIPCAPRKR